MEVISFTHKGKTVIQTCYEGQIATIINSTAGLTRANSVAWSQADNERVSTEGNGDGAYET